MKAANRNFYLQQALQDMDEANLTYHLLKRSIVSKTGKEFTYRTRLKWLIGRSEKNFNRAGVSLPQIRHLVVDLTRTEFATELDHIGAKLYAGV